MTDTQLDQGWSWVVGFASLIIHTLLASCYFAYGVFLKPWMNKFSITSASASLVGATASGLISLVAPISSYCISRWGCRFTVILGGLLATIGLIIASCAKSFATLFICYGILSGFGIGLTYVAAVVVLSEHFDKKRGIALGIASSGVGVGSFIFPLILEWLRVNYGVEGAILILASLVFHNCLCGMVMLPVRNKKPKKEELLDCNQNYKNITQQPKDILSSQDDNLRNNQDNVNSRLETSGNHEYRGVSEICDEIEISNISRTSNKKSSNQKRTFQCLRYPWIRRNTFLFQLGKTRDGTKNVHQESEFKSENNLKIANIPPSDSMLPPQSTFATQSRVILRHPLFYAMVVSNLTMFINMMMTFCLIPICAVSELGFSQDQGAFLVSIVGLTTMLGRFGWGMLITLIPRIKPFSLFVVLRVLASVLTFLSPLANTFALQSTYCALVGLCFGCWSIYPVVVSNVFGDGCLNVAFGYLEPFNGIGAILGPILGGYLLDVTGSSKTPFAISAAIQAAGILTTALIFKIYYSRESRYTKN